MTLVYLLRFRWHLWRCRVHADAAEVCSLKLGDAPTRWVDSIV